MFFSEKSHSPFPAFRSCVSRVAYAANAQHAPTFPWFLTGETQPCSHESHRDGSAVLEKVRKRRAPCVESTRLAATPFGDGR